MSTTARTAQPCAGPCNRAYRRTDTTTADEAEQQSRKPYYGEPHWCDHCTGIVARALTELPELVAAIHLEALNGTPTPGARVTHTQQTPPWPGEPARILTDLIAGGLMELEDDLRHLRGYSPRPVLPEGHGMSEAIAVLTGSLDWLLQEHPNCADPTWSPGASLLRWHHIAVRFTKRDKPRTTVKELPCPRCELLMLVKADGDDSVECGNCGNRLREDEYQRRVKQLAIFEAAKMRG